MKTKFLPFFCLTLSFIAVSTFAFSGNSNLTPPPPMSGTFTIGGPTPDYATFNLAITALTTNGVNGPVIFNVRDSIYHEQISIGSITGASATNTITFQSETGDSSQVILTQVSSTTVANNFTLQLNGCNYVIFKQITISRTGANTYGVVVEIAGTSSNDSFLNNHILGINAPTASLYLIAINGLNTINDNLVFRNNHIENGSDGIYLIGATSSSLESGNIIENNFFDNQYSEAIHIQYQNSPQILSNTINKGSYGIYAMYCDNNLRILKNKISLVNPLASGAGIYLYYCDGSGGNIGLTANNFISISSLGSNIVSGISMNLSTLQNIFYNSININNTSTSSKSIGIAGATTSGLDVRDNILTNTGGGYAYYVDANTSTPISLSNNNDLYITGSYIGSWKSAGNQATLANWKTASSLDANSISANPQFFTMTDLHTISVNVNALGVSLASSSTPVTSDIDGQTRNATTPDIGADEFNIDDIGVHQILLPGTICEYSTYNVTIDVKNYKSYAFTGSIPVYYKINNNPVVNATISTTTINANDSILYTFTTTDTFPAAGIDSISAGANITTDINTTNDDINNFHFTVHALPPIDAGPDVTACNGDTITLTATGAQNYGWCDGENTPSISWIVNDTATCILFGMDLNGCTAYDTITIFGITLPKPVAGFTYLTNNLTITVTDTSHDATSWYWNFGDGNADTVQNPVHTYDSSGTYQITLIVWNLCQSDTVVYSLNIVGINEYSFDDIIQVFPNPGNNHIIIQIPASANTPKKIKLYNSQGKIVYQSKSDFIKQNSFSIDVENYAAGIYTLELIFEQGIGHKKIVIR